MFSSEGLVTKACVMYSHSYNINLQTWHSISSQENSLLPI